MASLFIPDLCSDAKVDRLQISLAKMLSVCSELPIDQVHVMTQMIQSGLVVEDGKKISW